MESGLNGCPRSVSRPWDGRVGVGHVLHSRVVGVRHDVRRVTARQTEGMVVVRALPFAGRRQLLEAGAVAQLLEVVVSGGHSSIDEELHHTWHETERGNTSVGSGHSAVEEELHHT